MQAHEKSLRAALAPGQAAGATRRTEGPVRPEDGSALDPDVCYRALRSRDARFDGRFFTAVKTTGIYCRPVCPAPAPRKENVVFVACAAAAEAAGFRPCRRCRPETSPGTPAWIGTSTTVSRALKLIGEGYLDDHAVTDLADRAVPGVEAVPDSVHRRAVSMGPSPGVASDSPIQAGTRLWIETTNRSQPTEGRTDQ